MKYLIYYGIGFPRFYYYARERRAGRPRMNDRKAMSAIFYILRTGTAHVRWYNQNREMNDLLARAVPSHGGLDRWNKFKKVTAH